MFKDCGWRYGKTNNIGTNETNSLSIEVGGIKRCSAYIITTLSCSSLFSQAIYIVYGLITISANSSLRKQGRNNIAHYEELRDKNKSKDDKTPIEFDLNKQKPSLLPKNKLQI